MHSANCMVTINCKVSIDYLHGEYCMVSIGFVVLLGLDYVHIGVGEFSYFGRLVFSLG